MKLPRILAVSAIAASLVITTTVFAADANNKGTVANGQKSSIMREKGGFKGKGDFRKDMDPLKMLESRKENIQSRLKEGKITEEDSKAQIAKIDQKINEIKEFNTLTLEQKKAKLTSDFKAAMDQKVKDGRLTQAKADEMLKSFTEKLVKWDGTGYPRFGFGGIKGKGDFKGKSDFRGKDDFKKGMDPLKMLESRKENVQARLKDGKITEEDAKAETAKIDQKINEIKEFNTLTLDQKKAKLTSDFKAAMDQKVKDGKLTQAKADEMLKNFTERLAKWDGTGYPGFGMQIKDGKGDFGKRGHGKGGRSSFMGPAATPETNTIQ